MAVVRSITPDDVKMTVDMIKQGQMASVNPKVVDETGKRVLIQTERKSANGKTTTHYQVMTKSNPGCQGSVDFDTPSDADAARKIVESTTGAH
jgi:polyphosphate kinase 2 (PPK2 family)